ncbi:cell division regulator GpsB [Thalassorhabdus alkalitolerans]|uniref:Cell division regulator GpsB n=1 Tax=Thalassorhabdus alkalitolerans TaxID=2282697 RepID=A0ABW0YHF0_9BACI|nr:cell division regulator GpsB [Thalassobacillus sp. C254]
MQPIKLSAKDILDKEFKTSMKGYNKDEVDQYLDTIIQDYEAFQERIDELEKEVSKFKKQPVSEGPVQQAKQEPAQTTGSTNYDILKRLSNLEKEVFGKKLYE